MQGASSSGHRLRVPGGEARTQAKVLFRSDNLKGRPLSISMGSPTETDRVRRTRTCCEHRTKPVQLESSARRRVLPAGLAGICDREGWTDGSGGGFEVGGTRR